MLENLVPKIIDVNNNTYKLHKYKGIGSIPKNMKTVQDPAKRALLNQLPRLLSGYGKAFQYAQTSYAVIIVCDLDNRNESEFLNELNAVLLNTTPAPQTKFCLAIEEGEAWLLGDLSAIKKAYPKAKDSILHNYKNDSICGTWELLADAIYSGGSKRLKQLGFAETGIQKSEWAIKICPNMDISKNKSPSFNKFKDTLQSYMA